MTSKFHQKLSWAEENLKDTQRKIRRLMTAQKNWERRVKYYTLKCHEERAEIEVQKLATKMLAERTEKQNKFMEAAMPEGRRFRND